VPAVSKTIASSISQTGLTGLNATTGFTVSWWHRWTYDNFSQAQGAIFTHRAGNRNGYSVGFNASGEVSVVIYGSAGLTQTAVTGNSLSRSGRWAHCAVTFDDANNEILAYVNGHLMNRATNTRDLTSTTTSLTTSIALATAELTNYNGSLFDIQVFPDVVIESEDIRHLMNPLESVPGCKGRYFGVESRQNTSGAGDIRDASGSGNNLTTSSPVETIDEPPFRPTIA
jgi:hypothetical protein